MKFKIEHQIKGRVRIHICQKRMTCRQADQLEYFLSGLEGVTAVKVVERNQDAVICYNGDKLAILKAVQKFSYGASEAPESYLQNSGREMNSEYWEKMVNHVVVHIRSRQDVNEFAEALRNSRSTVLSSATSGYHYHLIEASSEERLDLIEKQLGEAGFLAPLQPWEQTTGKGKIKL